MSNPTPLPVVEVSFDPTAAEAQITALETTPGYTREIASLRSLASQAGSFCVTLKTRMEEAFNTLLKRSEEREADIVESEGVIKALEDEEIEAVETLGTTQRAYELACSKAGIETHEVGNDALEVHIAEKMSARHRLGVDVNLFLKRKGVPPPLQEEAELEAYKPTGVKQFSDWALRIVTGLLFGVGLLTLLGLVKERTITLQPEWLIIAIAIGATITSMAKVFVQKQAIAFFRRNYLKKPADGLAVATSIFAVAVVTMVVTVEALGIYAMFQQKASVAAAVSGGTAFAPPVFVLWAIALTSTGLLFGLAVSQAREAWEQEETFLDERAKVRAKHAKMVKDWEELAYAIENWGPSEPGIVEARQLAVSARHQTSELLRIQTNLHDERGKLARLQVSPARLTPHEEDDLKACYKQANEAVTAFNDAITSFGKTPKVTT